MNAPVQTPSEGAAEKLLGLVLKKQWLVIERLTLDAGHSGQSRSCCYKAVTKDGEVAFVKAFDFRHEDLEGDTQRLEFMVREFNHERQVHEFCRDRKLARVTRIFEAGFVPVDGQAVHYLICEYAPQSLREAHPPGSLDIPAHIRLAGLRKVAAGVAQLHTVGVAHQDIKPSNAVAYADDEVKITDLGSSSCQSLPAAPHDDLHYCGQPGYAPYELLYSQGGSWYRRRIGCDIYLLGNLIFTSFIGESLTSFILHALPSELRHTVYTGTYDQVLPHLIDRHFELVPIVMKEFIPAEIESELTSLVLALCHPDPERRGHSVNVSGKGSQYGLERVISALDRLEKKARIQERYVT